VVVAGASALLPDRSRARGPHAEAAREGAGNQKAPGRIEVERSVMASATRVDRAVIALCTLIFVILSAIHTYRRTYPDTAFFGGDT
jgi:hypothetical protein